ncbi:TonB-dependent receptor [Parasphingorhabdus sp. DH2-15]|uniref:TonB-dependent receptor n=1 Tax=Parasphingorhabdus sp. DH2-15 TaxID=3444112 RepID=UPI003F6883D1
MLQTGLIRAKSLARKNFAMALLSSSALVAFSNPAYAQEAAADEDAGEEGDAIIVTGIRSSLQSALNEKRNADSLIEVIQAEDIGKLPDQNLAEVLENVTGVQITRTAGVGTGVQIRGTNDNRTAINDVTTLSAGTGRGGISFEDINPAIIASVEVIKAPEAKTIEGAVGGTINLRTIRPLDLTDTILSVRAQGEYSELSDSIKPRISGSFGKVWSTGIGEIGVVLSGSYTEQEATSFRPRVDRDNLIPANAAVTAAGAPGPDFNFLGIQFLNQELENFEFETINFSGSLEWAPADNVKFYFDAIVNDQQRTQDSSRIQASGVSAVDLINVPATFETVNFGTIDGVDLGSIQAALTGTIQPNIGVDDDDPNLRFSSDTGARVTDSQVYRLGTEFEFGRFTARVEGSRAVSNTSNPNLSTTLNFINPNPLTPLDGSSNDNSVPFIFDLTGGALTFGIDFDSPFAPTVAQLLDPNNVLLDAVTASNNRTENEEDAFRIDTTIDVEDLTPFFTSFDLGYRYNGSSTDFSQLQSTFGTGAIANSPFGSAFPELLVAGPSNFGEFDGRELAFRNFLLIDPNLSFSQRDEVFATLQAALDATPGGQAQIANGNRLLDDLNPNSANNLGASFRIEEETHSFYAQANFEAGPVRGNFGLRWVSTDIDSFGNNNANGVVTPLTSRGSYQEWLPRVNFIVDVTDELVFRASYTEDINRPDFDDLSLSVTFPTGPNNAVALGNPNLAPETVESYDASLSWYFAPSSVISVGFFHKNRTNLFVTQVEDAPEDANGFRSIDPNCPGGGIFNPVPDRNVLSPVIGNGLCVPLQTIINDTASTRQTGIEVAFQYDLSQFEDVLGFASGFGIIANYTYQEFSGGQATNSNSGRGEDIFQAINPNIAVPVTRVQGLLDFSPHAYNVTLYYEKYGLSARARYTWRDSFRTLDTAGGASLNSTLGFPVVTESRGQLNAGINYDVTEFLNVGIEGVNLTKSRITQSCVNEGALLCFQGLPDRRIQFGATLSF